MGLRTNDDLKKEKETRADVKGKLR